MPSNSLQVLALAANDQSADQITAALGVPSSRHFHVERVRELRDALSRTRASHYDAVLVELDGDHGIDALEELVSAAPNAAVVGLTERDDEALGQHALALGAQDCVVKSDAGLPGLSRAVVFAIERRHLQATIVGAALTDLLTELPNRDYFQRQLDDAIQVAARYDELLAIGIIGIEGMDDIRQNFGHIGGDQVVREVARRLAMCVRAGDVVARIGDETFACLYPRQQRDAPLKRFAQRVGTALAGSITLPLRDTPGVARAEFDVRCAMLLYPRHGTDVDELMASADQALDRARRRLSRPIMLLRDVTQLSDE